MYDEEIRDRKDELTLKVGDQVSIPSNDGWAPHLYTGRIYTVRSVDFKYGSYGIGLDRCDLSANCFCLNGTHWYGGYFILVCPELSPAERESAKPLPSADDVAAFFIRGASSVQGR